MMILGFLLLFGVLQGLILSFTLLTRRSNQHANKLLGWLIFSLSVQIGLIGGNERVAVVFPEYQALTWTIPFLFAPLSYLYIRALLVETQQEKIILHFIPFGLGLIGTLPFLMLSTEAKLTFNILDQGSFFYIGFSYEIVRVAQAIYYGILGFTLINKYAVVARSQLSNFSLKWIRLFYYASMVSWTVAIFEIFTFFLQFKLPVTPFYTLYLVTIFFIYYIAYKVMSNPSLFGFEINEFKKSESKKYARSGLKSDEAERNITLLNQLMEEEQLFRNSELTISEVANRLGLPKHHLSQSINEHLGINFFDFVNSFRIEHVKTQLKDPSNDHLKILAIAFDAGFNSKSSFNELFKKSTGITPSKYRSK